MNSGDDQQTRTGQVLMSGTQSGRYRIVSSLGSGGMGEVLLAEDVELGRKVALKLLAIPLCQDPACRSRFVAEARAAAKIDHPNVITVHEVGDWNGRPYIVMQYVRGRTLREVIQQGRISLSQVVDYVAQICGGISAAHELGVVHRDIKPSNVMVDEHGRIFVVDFGLAADTYGDKTQTRDSIVGTAEYMSPEQVLGHAVDKRSDIFSLGILIYEMLTATSPFRRDSAAASMHAVVYDQPVSLTDHLAEIPVELQKVLDHALAKVPGDRYQKAQDLAVDFYMLGTTKTKSAWEPAPENRKVKSIAVLHVRNLGGDKDDFLSYVVTEDLIVDLTRLSVMRVASLRSIMSFRESTDKPENIGRELQVDLILDGSLRKVNDSFILSVQLMEVGSGKNLWAERWDAALEKLPEIRALLIKGLLGAVGCQPSPTTQDANSAAQAIRSPKAYELCLRAKFTFDHKQDASDIDVAFGLYRQAVQLDSSLIVAQMGLAEILLHKSEYDKAAAILQAALGEARKQLQRSEEGEILRFLATCFQSQSKWDEAKVYADQALELARTTNDLASEEEALGILISIVQWRANFDEALAYFDRVLAISSFLQDAEKVSNAIKNMGNVYLRKGEYGKALELYRQAMGMARKRNDLLLQAKCMANIGLVQSLTGKLTQAQQCHEKALQMYDQLEDNAGRAVCYNNIGLILGARGAYRKAKLSCQKAAEIHAGAGNRADYSLARANTARMGATIGEFEEAKALSMEALNIGRDLDYPFVMNVANDTLGYIMFRLGDVELAIGFYTEAMRISEAAGLRREASLAHINIAAIQYWGSQIEASSQHVAIACEISHAIGDKQVELRARAYQSALQVQAGDQEAIETLRDSLEGLVQAGDPRYITEVQNVLGRLLLTFGSEDKKSEGKALINQAGELAAKKSIVCPSAWEMSTV